MDLFENSAVLSFDVFPVEFKKKETVFVPGRKFHSLTFRKSGKITITESDKTFISDASSVTYVPKGVGYHTEVTESGSMIVIHFNLAKDDVSDKIKVFTPKNPAMLRNLFSALLNGYNAGNPVDYGSFSILYEILATISRDASLSVSPRMQKVKEYIDKSFQNPTLSVSLIAEKFGISEVYLRREFKASFDITPLSYINKIRLENAKAMLKTGYYSVGTVSENCGYLSLSYFSYAFRNAVGLSPSEYMKNHLL